MKEEKELKLQNIYKNIMIVVVTAFITFILTSVIMYKYIQENAEYASLSDTTTATSLSSYLKKIKSVMEKYYLWSDEINDDELAESAIKGYVEGLGDKYTEYIPADEMEKYTENLTGSFVGIGVYMVANEESDRIIIYYAIPNSPAANAGIQSGDKIVSIDGTEYTVEDFDTISDYIKGEEGTKVKLVIDRDGEQIEFEMTREKIDTNPITIENLDNDIGYLKLPSFDDGTADSFKANVQELINNGAKSLIIDLRNDGGGIVDEATQIADYFLDKGEKIISTVDNKGNEEVTCSENDPIFDMPIVILVNENTASASEILTSALQDYNKATVVGTTTYGKGIIQTFFKLTDGSGLKITTAQYYTPKGTSIHGVGITPDEEVELPDTVTSIYYVTEEQDTQLKKAIEILEKE